jgi:hypothetical protein
MKHLIDPTIDCVFNAILGMEGNEEVLVHFLNCILINLLRQLYLMPLRG